MRMRKMAAIATITKRNAVLTSKKCRPLSFLSLPLFNLYDNTWIEMRYHAVQDSAQPTHGHTDTCIYRSIYIIIINYMHARSHTKAESEITIFSSVSVFIVSVVTPCMCLFKNVSNVKCRLRTSKRTNQMIIQDTYIMLRDKLTRG